MNTKRIISCGLLVISLVASSSFAVDLLGGFKKAGKATASGARAAVKRVRQAGSFIASAAVHHPAATAVCAACTAKLAMVAKVVVTTGASLTPGGMIVAGAAVAGACIAARCMRDPAAQSAVPLLLTAPPVPAVVPAPIHAAGAGIVPAGQLVVTEAQQTMELSSEQVMQLSQLGVPHAPAMHTLRVSAAGVAPAGPLLLTDRPVLEDAVQQGGSDFELFQDDSGSEGGDVSPTPAPAEEAPVAMVVDAAVEDEAMAAAAQAAERDCRDCIRNQHAGTIRRHVRNQHCVMFGR